MTEVKKGDKIKVNYTGKFEDGTIFDSSEGREPLGFEAGAGQMISGFDKAVIGMKVGDKKTITLEPKEGYGEKDDKKIVELDKMSFSNFENLEIGMQVVANTGLPGKVIEKNQRIAKVDFNHELAGKKLVFDIELVSIE